MSTNMFIQSNRELIKDLLDYPMDAVVITRYSDDINSGSVKIGYDSSSNTIQIIGSSEDI